MSQQVSTSHPFLQSLDDKQRTVVASGTRPFTTIAGELLAREGEPAVALYLIQTGHVAIEIHREGQGSIRLQTVGPGEIVGWSWLFPPHRWQFDARAMEAVSGLAIDAQWLREKCAQDHELGYCLLQRLLGVISARLAATRLQLLDLYK